jgi:hypothetical protein
MDIQYLYETPPWQWPDDAGETLLEVLQNQAAPVEERRRAAELASSVTVMDDRIAEALLAVLRDPSAAEELRGQAAISLGPVLEEMDMELEWEDPDDLLISEPVFRAIQDTLHRLYLDAEAPKYVRRRALEASVRALADWHESAVRAAYHSGDEEWSRTAVFAMSHLPGFDAEILEALESPDPELHYEAVRAAGSRGLKEAWRHVKGIVQNERGDKALLLAAIEAVGGIRPDDAADILADLSDHDDEDIAEAVEEALSMSSEPWDEDDEEEW